MARMMGTTCEGQALYFGDHFYDFPFVTVGEKTVINNSLINGHSATFEKLTLGPCYYLSRTLHPYCFAMANTRVTAKESGPQ
jgi:hypothetical protein